CRSDCCSREPAADRSGSRRKTEEAGDCRDFLPLRHWATFPANAARIVWPRVDVLGRGFTMKSIIVISLSIALVTPALAAKKHHHHYTRPIGQRAQPPSMAMGTMGPITAANWQEYQKALRESGYNPKNDYQSNGAIRDHLP